MNQGDLGVIALNQKLQSKLVPKMEGMPWIKVNNLESVSYTHLTLPTILLV